MEGSYLRRCLGLGLAGVRGLMSHNIPEGVGIQIPIKFTHKFHQAICASRVCHVHFLHHSMEWHGICPQPILNSSARGLQCL